jgi:ankyrin repeat protein
MTMFRLIAVAFVAAMVVACASGPSLAQVAPTGAELAAYTGLHAAAAQGDVALIKQLVAAGANVNATDAYRRTPMHVAAYQSHDEALLALAEAGGDPNLLEADRYDIITIAAVADDAEMVRTAVKAGGSAANITSVYDGTALIAAAHEGNWESIDVLIKAGAPLDHVNNLGWTAMIEAVVLGDGGERHQKSLKLLIDAGADKSITDRSGRTPLDLGRERGYEAMVKMLEGS